MYFVKCLKYIHVQEACFKKKHKTKHGAGVDWS